MEDPALQATQNAQVKPGDVLGGKFKIERVLGQGGMGMVVQAQHLQLEQRVALKFLLPDMLLHPETVTRFAREARAAAKIKSEHVARVIDVGTLDTGSPYIVMEYLDGDDLAHYLRQRGPLSAAEATMFVLQACEALAEAHAAGIVHRDLKPANLFLTRYPDGTPCVKILDFGISKISGGSSGRDFDMTRTTAILGSPYYMSPEQMRSTRAVDQRTDIWSLGVILYELVSARLPFEAETMPQLCGMVLQEPPAPLASLSQTGLPGFEAVVLRCLEKDAAHRFQSVGELAMALAPFATAESQRSLDRVARLSGAPSGPRSGSGATNEAGVPAASSTGLTQTDFGRTASHRGGSRGLLAGVGALGLVGAAVAAWFLHQQPAAGTSSPAMSAVGAQHDSANTGSRGTPAPPPAEAPPPAMPQAAPPTEAAPSASPTPSATPEPTPPPRAGGARPRSHGAPAPPPAAPAPAATPRPAPAATPRPVSPLDGRL